MSQTEQIFNKILKNNQFDTEIPITDLTGIVSLMRELHLSSEILGREYEVLDNEGKLICTIKQKRLNLAQINILMNELKILADKEKQEIEKAKSKGKAYKKPKL